MILHSSERVGREYFYFFRVGELSEGWNIPLQEVLAFHEVLLPEFDVFI
jgi:hypothetical protein